MPERIERVDSVKPIIGCKSTLFSRLIAYWVQLLQKQGDLMANDTKRKDEVNPKQSCIAKAKAGKVKLLFSFSFLRLSV